MDVCPGRNDIAETTRWVGRFIHLMHRPFGILGADRNDMYDGLNGTRLGAVVAADPDSDGKTGHIRRTLATAVAVPGCVMALVQFVEYLDSGKFNYILSGIFTLMGVFGIAGLLSMKNRRSSLASAAVTLAILVSALGAVFFGYFAERRLPGLAPEAEGSSGSPFSGMAPSPTAQPIAPPPPASEGFSPPSLADVTPSRMTQPPAEEPGPGGPSETPPVQPVTRGIFTDLANGQNVRGWRITPVGTIENYSSTLLCIVRDESGNYFPYTAQSANGRWSAEVGIGPQTIGRSLPFTLILATADQTAVDSIRWQQQTKPYYNTKGLGSDLPSGIGILAEVGIIRTS